MWKRKDPRIHTLTPEALRNLANAIEAHQEDEQGDGEAVFLSDMTEDEFEDHQYKNDLGWKEVVDKVEGLPAKQDGGGNV